MARKTKGLTLKKLNKKVNSLSKGVEMKFHDENASASGVRYGVENVSLLFDPVQGLLANNRIGDTVSPKSIDLKIELHQTNTLAAQPESVMVRVMLLQSKHGFVPQSVSVSDATGVLTFANTNKASLSPFIEENRVHFKVLHDQNYIVGPRGVDTNMRYIRIRKKLSGVTRFTESGIGVENNGLYLFMTSDVDVATTAPNRTWASRVSYTDN